MCVSMLKDFYEAQSRFHFQFTLFQLWKKYGKYMSPPCQFYQPKLYNYHAEVIYIYI